MDKEERLFFNNHSYFIAEYKDAKISRQRQERQTDDWRWTDEIEELEESQPPVDMWMARTDTNMRMLIDCLTLERHQSISMNEYSFSYMRKTTCKLLVSRVRK